MNHKRNVAFHTGMKFGRTFDIACLVLLCFLAIFVSTSYRGIFSDDTRGYVDLGEFAYTQHRWGTELGSESVASILYPLSITVVFPFFGRTLVASHAIPFLLAVLTPLLFYALLRRIFNHWLWAFGGTLLFICYPTNIVYLNQNLTEPVFVFCAVLTMLLLEYAKKRPAFLIAVGIASSLMVLARLFDGMMFSAIVFLVLLLHWFKKSFETRWLFWSVVAFIGVQLVCSFVLRFSLFEYWNYFSHMVGDRNSSYTQGLPAMLRTKAAIKSYLTWYFGGKLFPFLVGLLLLGIVSTFRRAVFYPFFIVSAYSLFLFIGLGGRQIEPYLLRLSVKVIPALVVLLVGGGKMLYEILFHKVRIAAYSFLVLTLLLVGHFCYTKNIAYFAVMADIIPPASFLQIIRHNSSIPTQEYELENKINIREEIHKEVKGFYRSSYLSRQAKSAFEEKVPQQLQTMADFSYHDDFTDGIRWKNDAILVEGNSLLWTDTYPEHLGAFPAGADGTVVYKFTFPKSLEKVSISDIHTQWEHGDIVRMWTSVDGKHWILRYDNDLRYQKTYYHQVFEQDFDGLREMYVKYYFYAGDTSRKNGDNRGASLKEFFLSADFQQ